MLVGVGGLGLMACLHHLRVPWVWHLMDDVPSMLCQLDGRVVPALAREFARQLRGHTTWRAASSSSTRSSAGGIRLPGEVEVVPNWVAGAAPAAADARSTAAATAADRLGRRPDRPEYDKGIDLLIKAAALLRDRGRDDFSLDIYGQVDDSYSGDLIQTHGLGDLVALPGPSAAGGADRGLRRLRRLRLPDRGPRAVRLRPAGGRARGCVPVMSHGLRQRRVAGPRRPLPEGRRGPPRRSPTRSAEILDGRVDLEPIAPPRRRGRPARLPPRRAPAPDRAGPGRAARRPRAGAGTADEAYRLALLAEKLTGC